jgi:tetratricopeptide (TPR) repeat protein
MMLAAKKNLRSCLTACFVIIFLLFRSSSPAFPLRTVQPGSPLPPFTLPVLGGGEADVIGGDGQITVILFWSTDSESKLERGVELLHTLQAIGENYGDKGIVVRSVNIDKNNRDVVRQIMERDGITVPVLLDEKEKLYGAYGLFILPTVAIVDRDGTLKTAAGYTRSIAENITGEIEIMLGLRTAEDLEKSLNPEEVIEAPDNILKAQRHLNLGRKFLERSLLDMAGDEFAKAVELDPLNAEAHAELGAFHTRREQYDTALAELEKAVELAPDLVQARFALGILHRKKGETDRAVSEFEGVLELEPAHAPTFSELGAVFEDMGEMDKALANYRKALVIAFDEEPAAE